MTLALLSIADSTAIAAFFAALASIVGVVVSARSARSTKRAEDAANRAVAATKPNGGESLEQGGTLADALVRIEAQVERHSTFTAEQFAQVNGSLRAGGERMARLEATTTATREDVGGLRNALGAEAQRRAGVEARLSDHIEDHHRTEVDHR